MKKAHETPYYPVMNETLASDGEKVIFFADHDITVWDHYVESAMRGLMSAPPAWVRQAGRLAESARQYAHAVLTENGWLTPLSETNDD